LQFHSPSLSRKSLIFHSLDRAAIASHRVSITRQDRKTHDRWSAKAPKFSARKALNMDENRLSIFTDLERNYRFACDANRYYRAPIFIARLAYRDRKSRTTLCEVSWVGDFGVESSPL